MRKKYDQLFTFGENVTFDDKCPVHLDGKNRCDRLIEISQSQRLEEGLKSVSQLRTINQINNYGIYFTVLHVLEVSGLLVD